MSNKSILQSIMAIAFVLLICIPGLLLIATGGEDRMSGEEELALPAFTVGSWLNQEFQSSFETWFSRSYNGRRLLVRAYTDLESLEAAAEHRVLEPLRMTTQNEDNLSSIHAVVDALAAARETYAAPAFAEYVVEIPKAVDQSSFRGADGDIVGTDGVLFADMYVAEVFGFAPRYSGVTDAELESKVRQLAYIQQQLQERGIAFTVVITPNKAAYYAEYIPEFYFARNTMPEGYERPYTRFLALLKSEGVSHVDSGTVFAENGLQNSFPMTGIHWNSLASVPVAQAVMAEGSRQLGVPTRGLITTGVISTEGSVDFEQFAQEQDILETIYGQRPAELKRAIVDPYYYRAMTEVVNPDAEPLKGVWIQGGSFRNDIENRFLYDAGYTNTLISSNYNDMIFERDGALLTSWEDVLSSVSHVVFEINEQFVYNMGGSRPWEIDESIKPREIGDFNIHDALEAYLRGGDNSAFAETQETASIVVGNNDMIFQRNNVAELYGASSQYTGVTDAYLSGKVERLADMQDALQKRGIAFTVLITPSKAATCAEDIPDWYRSRLEMPTDYVRPYERLLTMLRDKKVTVLDSAGILAQNSISPVYAATAARWNPVASLTVAQAVLAEYTDQTGRITRNFELVGVQESAEPFLFNVWGNTFTNELNLLDELPADNDYPIDTIRYQAPQVQLTHMNEPRYENMLLHGGEYTNEIIDWVGEQLMGVRQFRHNEQQVEDWDELMSAITYVVIEINEADVYDMDAETLGDEYNFMDELYRYLMGR